MSHSPPEPLDGSGVIPAEGHAHAARLGVLDGWRAISILFVLAAHMLPIGPKPWRLNFAAGLAGMSLFFTLSGFLITSTLERNPTVASFLIRRICRIVPLAFLASIAYLLIQHSHPAFYPAHLLFYVNYDDVHITEGTGHLWSLSVEIQFYMMAALAFGLVGIRGMAFLAALGLAITGYRLFEADPFSNRTHLRVDEILSGVALALAYSGRLGLIGRLVVRAIRAVPLAVWGIAFLVSCHELNVPMVYFRNYLAAGLIGRTLLVPDLRLAWLQSRPMRYIAEISFALYVIHPVTMHGWLGSGGTIAKYLKRPLCLALTVGLAHLSTFYYERPWIAWGKRWARFWDHGGRPAPAQLLDPTTTLDSTRR